MWEVLSIVVGIVAGLGLSAHLAVRFLAASRRRRDAPDHLYGSVKAVLEDARYENGPYAGFPQLVGQYRDRPVRLLAVVDTLAVRKLPVLWLLATMPERLPVTSTFDLMMRPAGPTTFSNFDNLPASIPRPLGFPDQAVIRTDDPRSLLPAFVVEPHLAMFEDVRAKELLISPKGVRIVWQIAEADRARYGVFRQAEFGDVALDPVLVRNLLDRLVAIRKSILAWGNKTT